MLHLMAQDASAARRMFEDAIAANPENARALAGLGSCHMIEGEKRKAHDAFAKSLDLEINQPAVVYQLIKCAYELKTYATAARLAEAYAEAAPINPSLMYSLAGLQFHLGRREDARGTARRILGMQADHAGARGLLKLIERTNV
jgi:Tfp pilus assembly protein PilF